MNKNWESSARITSTTQHHPPSPSTTLSAAPGTDAANKFVSYWFIFCFLELQHEYCLFSFISTVWNWGLMAKEGDPILQTVKFYEDMQWLKFIFETVVPELL